MARSRTLSMKRNRLGGRLGLVLGVVGLLAVVCVTWSSESKAISASATPAATPNGFASLISFNFTDGLNPEGALVRGADGNLYGTTANGGANSYGTVFRLALGGGLSTLYNFCSVTGCLDGNNPQAGLVQGIDGNFYGTTASGGTSLAGTAFKITPGGILTTLYNFCSSNPALGCTDGQNPTYSPLIQGTDGNFYGTTVGGGTGAFTNGGGGTVFKITPEGSLTTLYSFCSQPNCTDGYRPEAGLVQGTDGNFYGTTYGGGTVATSCSPDPNIGCGTIFKITPAGELTTLPTATIRSRGCSSAAMATSTVRSHSAEQTVLEAHSTSPQKAS
jgi:uncharacterized repeat protein (TIGR03803 family)